jgi:hypothetical protein
MERVTTFPPLKAYMNGRQTDRIYRTVARPVAHSFNSWRLHCILGSFSIVNMNANRSQYYSLDKI